MMPNPNDRAELEIHGVGETPEDAQEAAHEPLQDAAKLDPRALPPGAYDATGGFAVSLSLDLSTAPDDQEGPILLGLASDWIEALDFVVRDDEETDEPPPDVYPLPVRST